VAGECRVKWLGHVFELSWWVEVGADPNEARQRRPWPSVRPGKRPRPRDESVDCFR
jgi:hypothetical protein